MKKIIPLLLAITGALLNWAAWPVSGMTILIFVSWVPMLWIESEAKSGWKFFGLTYLHMFAWNILVTWWVWYASEPGALGAFFANSLIMCLPWLLFRITKKRFGSWIGYGSLIIFWLSFEYIHHNWELSWPWLTLGNVFATNPNWVQWYEYTGTTGGSLWVLLSNILVFAAIQEYRTYGRSRGYYLGAGSWICCLLLPMLASQQIKKKQDGILQKSLARNTWNVVVVQPNIDPYTEKFAGDIQSQVQKLILLSENQIDNGTTLVVWPETAIPAQVWENEITINEYYQPIWSFLKRHPRVNLLTGIDSYKNYGANKANATATSRFEPSGGIYYDAFNTAAYLSADTSVQLYHKAKLVPGAETLPSFLNFLSGWFEHFGGMSGTLGRASEQKVFVPWDHYYKAAPIICYESIFSEYVAGYVRRGANILTIITNDGWWKDTPGYKQHMNYARLRAIETRCWVARSANTGVSCFIDPVGDVIDPQAWQTASSIKFSVPPNEQTTFFVKHGDMLSRASVAIAVLLLLIDFGLWIRNKFFKHRFPALQA